MEVVAADAPELRLDRDLLYHADVGITGVDALVAWL